MRFSDTPLLWTVDDVYSADECQRMIARIEAGNPTIATNNPIYRNQDRVMRDDPDLSKDLFDRLKPCIPAKIGELKVLGLNDRLRFYRYVEGQQFEPHMDHWYQPSPTEITLLTVLVYFNGDFEGGETRFTEQIGYVVRPKPGRAALFQHKIRHEGCVVRSGSKYALRTDVLYRAPLEVELTYA